MRRNRKPQARRFAIPTGCAVPGRARSAWGLARALEAAGRRDEARKQYQAYLERLALWQTTLVRLTGNTEVADTLRGLEAELAALDTEVGAREEELAA